VVAGTVLLICARGWLDRARWPVVLLCGYLGGLAWALALALVDGEAGLTRALASPEEYLVDLGDIGNDPLRFIREFTLRAGEHSIATRGHPPAPVLLLWGLTRLGVTDHLVLGLLVTAVGAATVPLVLAAVRDVAGESAARRYLPVLVLAPYAVWLAVSLDAVVATLGAAAVVAGVRASRHRQSGWHATGRAAAAGLLTGVAALFSYSAAWLGLSVVLVYFARRRPFLNLATGLAALVPVGVAHLLGFRWVDGLLATHADYASRIEPNRSVLWWSGISLVALLLAAGPPLVTSLRKVRNTPGWPVLVGAGIAVLFSILAGLARGGVEHAWLPFFPWLTVAAVAPERPAGPAVPAPLLLTGLGALVAIVVEAVLATPW
jgi:methylthioxylose transferase